MNLPRELFLDTNIHDENICLICFQIFYEPLEDDCQFQKHVFCRECIKRWIQSHGKCPVSKKSLSLNNLTLKEDLQAIINELDIKCENYTRKCSWLGKVKDYAKHLTECPKRIEIQMSKLVAMPTSHGGQFKDVLIDDYVNNKPIELVMVIMEFSRIIYVDHWHVTYNSLSSIELVWRFKDETNENLIFGKKAGGSRANSDPRNVEMREVFRIERGDSLEACSICDGTYFYPRIGFKTKKYPEFQYFGFSEYPGNEHIIELPENSQIIGLYGASGWVVDSLGFIFKVEHDE